MASQQAVYRRQQGTPLTATAHDPLLADDDDEHLLSTAHPPAPAPAPAPTRTVSIDTTNKTCWICYTTESEDPSLAFIHPCSCTLLAHPDCLLEWISTQQAMHPATRPTPRCPACGTQIRIHQDRSEVLRWYRQFRRSVDRASLAAGVGSIAASAWFVSAAYGAWALKTFMGEQVTEALLLRHQNGLPWRYWLNLPLIPISLVLSRTPLIDSLLPFLPLTLVLSTHTHTHAPFSYDPIGIDDLSLRWPPSPTLTVCLLPWLRLLYLRLRYKVFRAVLGRRKQFRGLAGVFEEAAMDEVASFPAAGDGDGDAEEGEEGVSGGDMVGLVATFEVETEEGGEAGRRHDGVTADREEEREDGDQERPNPRLRPAQVQLPPTPPATESIRLRVGLGRLTSLVLGALIFPALSSLAGSALFWLASRQSSAKPFRVLRHLLGLSTILGGVGSSSSLASSSSSGGLGWIRALIASGLSTSNPIRSRPAAIAGVDPKWVRNTLGAGLVLLTRDAVELTVGLLDQKRQRSRRIVERPFRPRSASGASRSGHSNHPSAASTGAEFLQGEGHGAEEVAPSPTVMSGGRDAHGREAIVHNFL
ncbi:hypothetical protein C6P46_007149 [Rhodotorula mucilaginosa]|uniref:RING-CH-type domain-containing protein n=1 Tax=Rhodotorula mucilaginosa TaxID=5537 RepID=A0A9P6VXA4_RHOMI|nr:hypothetical protein C6P46_007149 [Rhodotorula mucilaginosa]